jgi:hypothetical protein
MELKLNHPSDQELFLTGKEITKVNEMGRTYPNKGQRTLFNDKFMKDNVIINE